MVAFDNRNSVPTQRGSFVHDRPKNGINDANLSGSDDNRFGIARQFTWITADNRGVVFVDPMHRFPATQFVTGVSDYRVH